MQLKNGICNLVLAASISLSASYMSGCCTPISMRDYYQNSAKYQNTKYSAAILIANEDPAQKFWVENFLWAYEWRIADALEDTFGVDSYYIKLNATKQDLENVLLDDKFKIIIVSGHGSSNTWNAHDKIVQESDLEKLVTEHPNISKDWFIRHTCGNQVYETEILPPEARKKILEEIKGAGGRIYEIYNTGIDYYVPRREDNLRIMNEINESKIKAKVYFGTIVVNKTGHVLGYDKIVDALDFMKEPFPGK